VQFLNCETVASIASISLYVDYYTPITIICPKHGEFKQRPFKHLCGNGCLKCVTIVSKQETAWLDYLNIPQEYRQIYIKINNKKYYADAYDPNTKTVYEFYGDFWHGNPNNPRFPPENINKRVKKPFKQLYEDTLKKEEQLNNAGYRVISIWEFDWKLFNHRQK
jgi:hypothetical protein